jgi:hypothetical protein
VVDGFDAMQEIMEKSKLGEFETWRLEDLVTWRLGLGLGLGMQEYTGTVHFLECDVCVKSQESKRGGETKGWEMGNAKW